MWKFETIKFSHPKYIELSISLNSNIAIILITLKFKLRKQYVKNHLHKSWWSSCFSNILFLPIIKAFTKVLVLKWLQRYFTCWKNSCKLPENLTPEQKNQWWFSWIRCINSRPNCKYYQTTKYFSFCSSVKSCYCWITSKRLQYSKFWC